MSTSVAATVADACPELRLSLLGRFSLEQAGRAVRLQTRKEEGLLAYLVLHPGPHTRETLADLYWGDTPELQARGSLRAALASLRAALGPAALLSDREAVQFNPSPALSVDALLFETRATQFLRDLAADPAAFDPTLYRGELLAGHYDDWVLAERERLRQLFLDALVHLVARLRTLARFDAAIAAAQQALAVEPAEERAHQHLIYLYAVTGNRPAALRQLEFCRRSLKQQLDVEPSPETLAVLESVPCVAAEAALSAARTGSAPALNNLPVPLTSFIGRERELAEISRLLEPGGPRIVTLTGAGGSGKTRLAIQSARRTIEHWPDGVWWSDLSTLQDAALLPQTILAPFDVATPPGHPPLQALTSFLSGRNLLLVLDNCEHLAEACAHLLAAVLGLCPRVQVLATSREPLGVPGEQLWPVPTFSVPSSAGEGEVEGILGYDAIRLFVDRARMQQPAFELSGDNATEVAEICRRLDGIPLAIELAAARVRSMALGDILARLERRLRLLASASALAPPRHQTLRASIDWSYNQLSPPECLLMQRLAVFVGGCTLPAAEAICAGEGLCEEEVLDVLGRLVDRSLIVAKSGRYRMLETIREYALERLLDAGEAEAMHDRHSEYYLDLVRAQDSLLCSREQKAALARMEVEIANIRLALEWATAARRLERLCDISFPLLYFYELRAWHREGESIFRDAAAKLEAYVAADPETELRRQIAVLDMQTNRSYFCMTFATAADVYALLCECTERLRSLGDRSVLRYSLRYAATTASALGRYDEAEAGLKESLALSEEAGRTWDIGIVYAYLGSTTKNAGAIERSETYFGRALEIGRQLGDPRLLAFALYQLASLLLMLDQPLRAQELAQEALCLSESTGDRYALALSSAVMAEVAIRLGDPAKARALLAYSIKLWEEVCRPTALTRVYISLGHVALAVGEQSEAEAQFHAALANARRYQQDVPALSALAGLASVLAERGEAEAAAELSTVVMRHARSSAATRIEVERLYAQLVPQLTSEQIQAAERRAGSESFKETVDRLLAVPPA